MIRRTPIAWSRSGRRPATLKRVSAKRRRAKLGTKADPVYQAVDRRSGGRCENPWCYQTSAGDLRRRRATDHHHLRKPRASWHREELIVHLCRYCHARCEAPYAKGRLVIESRGTAPFYLFSFQLVRARDKWAARAQGA